MKFTTQILTAAAFAAIATTGINAQTPSDPAPLNYDPAEVGVIYAADQDTFFEVLRDGNGNPATDWNQPVWGQKVVTSDDECAGGAAAIRIDNLDYLPMQFPGTISLAQWRWLHVDIYPTTDDQVCFKFQNWWPGEQYVTDIYELKGGVWNSIDIDMEDAANFQWSEIKTDPETQEKYTNKGINIFQVAGEKIPNDFEHAPTIYMTNIIAHNYDPAESGNDEGNDDNAVEDILDDAAKGKIYNVFGVQVDETFRGIVIRDGKKYIQR